MTFREALAGGDHELRRRLDALLESDDAVIVMVDRHGVASYAHGFGISGCQLEFMIREVEAAVRLASGLSGDDLAQPASGDDLAQPAGESRAEAG